MLKFIRQWRLPIAMVIGLLGARWTLHLGGLMPPLIFMMLLFTFSNIEIKDLRIQKIHWVMLLCQAILPIIVFFVLSPINKTLALATMICTIAPAATSSAVVTHKLGGSAAILSSFTLVSNILTAIAVSVLFPLLQDQKEVVSFWLPFQKIAQNLFLLLILPFLTSLVLRSTLKPVHSYLARNAKMSFYLWMIALAIVSGRTYYAMIHSSIAPTLLIQILIAALLVCLGQFGLGKTLGKYIGRHHIDQNRFIINGGQMIGQKNTILAIWMAQTFLDHPHGMGAIIAFGAGSYVLWQNIVNGIQLARVEK
ncbi:MAG TPA: transporter [Bacteroidaceae bacterium]|nr:transporter [Bacteroidaceae bacterium]